MHFATNFGLFGIIIGHFVSTNQKIKVIQPCRPADKLNWSQCEGPWCRV